MKVVIVRRNKIEHIPIEEVSIRDIGQKAKGLCLLPKAWTCPFFVVSRELYVDFQKENYPNIVKEYIRNILIAIKEMKLDKQVIIRSSGEKEGMAERGRYESIVTSVDDIERKFVELLEKLKDYKELKQEGIPFIVQSYIEAEYSGHISNERRFTEDKRRFVFEYQYAGGIDVETNRVYLKKENINYDLESYKSKQLVRKNNLTDIVRVVGYFFYLLRDRVHLEFVCKNSIVYIVQCDIESPNNDAVNPENYDITMFAGEEFYPKVLRSVRESDEGKYKKIDNVFVYKAVGERIPPLFLIDDNEILTKLQEGVITKALREDLEFMTKRSLVIRTNVISDDIKKVQLSKRSNEIRSLEEAESFLFKASKQLLEEGVDKYIFILHNFIPAKIAAFINPKPMERVVEIQTLWGLPEGLYYNAHDRIIVDTMELNIDKVNPAKAIVIRKNFYKENFIAPDENGRWVVKKLKPPYDWQCTLVDDTEIKDIAYRARKIAEYVGEELSIMWFIGVDHKYYKVNNMPWYHEKYDRNNNYYGKGKDSGNLYKKKYFYEKEVVIKSIEDLNRMCLMDGKEIGIVRIQPMNDELLRSKDFIEKIGGVCKEKGINIFLEGAALAHSYYQLIHTGATVLNSYEIKAYEEKIEFNKLVRDYIPKILIDNGENVEYAALKGVALVRELKSKLIEEAYEVLAAVSKEELIEELADLEEVCIALEKKWDVLEKNDYEIIENSDQFKVVFECAIPESIEQYKVIDYAGYGITVGMKREKSDVQIDIIVGEKKVEVTEKEENRIHVDEVIKEILQKTFEINQVYSIEECKLLLQQIRIMSEKIREKYHCNNSQFEQIRESKLKKKGGFDKGYIVYKSVIENKEQEDFFEMLPQCEPVDVYELKEKEDIKIERIKNDSLLIRIKFPISSRENIWEFEKKKINEFFKEEVRIKFSKEIRGTKLLLNFDVVKSPYEQLSILGTLS